MANAIGQAIAVVLMFGLRVAFKLLVVTGKAVFFNAAAIGKLLVRRRANEANLPAPAIARAVGSASGNAVAAPQTIEAEGPPTVFIDGFEAADRIVSMRLEPAVGVINLRVFNEARVVKRDLIIHEPRLKALMGGRRHSFPDVPYVPLAGLDGIKDDVICEAERLINQLGNQSVKGTKPRKDDFERTRQQPPRVETPAEPPAREAAAAAPREQAAPSTVRPEVAAGSHLVAPQIKQGYTYVGRLASAGPKRMVPRDRPPYEVFEAVLQLANGAEMAMRGAELERELSACGGTVGKTVAITPMGKVPVGLSGGGEGLKNLYRVQVQ